VEAPHHVRLVFVVRRNARTSTTCLTCASAVTNRNAVYARTRKVLGVLMGRRRSRRRGRLTSPRASQ
jgi:hypothetical protein